MKLVYKGTDKEVKKGDILTDFRGNKAIADYFREPDHGVGKICVKDIDNPDGFSMEYYVSVFNLEWID